MRSPRLRRIGFVSWSVIAWLLAGLAGSLRADETALERGFTQPPEQTKPWVYWYWLSDNVSREGVTRDLEAMARVGIGEALIGNIGLDDVPNGRVKMLTDEWWGLVEHALREGQRVGVNIGLFNSPGWSQSGGPWVKPEQAMRYLVSSEISVRGPQRFSARLSPPAGATSFQRVAVSALRESARTQRSLHDLAPPVTPQRMIVRFATSASDASVLADGKRDTALAVPAGTPAFDVEYDYATELVARSLELYPGPKSFRAKVELLAVPSAGAAPVSIRHFVFDRSNMEITVGPMPQAPAVIALPAVKAACFILRFSDVSPADGTASLAEVKFSPVARLESFVEKQLGKMFQTPLPLWDAYLWPAAVEPDTREFTHAPDEIVDLSARIADDGTLTWEVPEGEWTILQTGMTPTGTKNSPAPAEGRGLEVDKMNRAFTQDHFEAYLGELLRRVPTEARRAFTRVVADSYETGSQNWTDGLEKNFREIYGYDPRPWLATLTGRIVGSAEQSERFLWDLRRLVADRVATQYVGGLRAAANAHGLGLWLENYGHWGFPSEFLKYGSESDRVGGEYWVTGDLGSIECRAASSMANTYGRPFVSAESFTGGPPFQNSPRHLKARGDWAFTEGVNHFVLHVYIHQPTDRAPGINTWFGTEFNRLNTWFEASRAWIDYLRRTSWMLQQGNRVADVAYFIGEDAPKMTGLREPALPAGYDFDYINADVIEHTLEVRDGHLVLPHGTRYRVLVLPPLDTMRPELLHKIHDLVTAGAVVYGRPPTRSPSLEGFPAADDEVRELARELWGDAPLAATGERQIGDGRLIWGRELASVLASLKAPPDFSYAPTGGPAKLLHTHRSTPDTEIYFVTNQLAQAVSAECSFRVTGRQPELWNAVTGERRDLSQWREGDGRTQLTLEFAENESWFVVFQHAAPSPPSNGRGNFPAERLLATLSGDWDVTFDAKAGAPKPTRFTALTDWSKQADAGLKFFSGKATYRRTIKSPMLPAARSRLWLDLGDVHDLAVVRVNGRDVGTVWTAPWRVDVTQAWRSGENRIEIDVITPWNNRLVGDTPLPEAQRHTWLINPGIIKPDFPLLPAGLLGPVTLQAGER